MYEIKNLEEIRKRIRDQYAGGSYDRLVEKCGIYSEEKDEYFSLLNRLESCILSESMSLDELDRERREIIHIEDGFRRFFRDIRTRYQIETHSKIIRCMCIVMAGMMIVIGLCL